MFGGVEAGGSMLGQWTECKAGVEVCTGLAPAGEPPADPEPWKELEGRPWRQRSMDCQQQPHP